MERVENDQKSQFFYAFAANPGFIEIPSVSNLARDVWSIASQSCCVVFCFSIWSVCHSGCSVCGHSWGLWDRLVFFN